MLIRFGFSSGHRAASILRPHRFAFTRQYASMAEYEDAKERLLRLRNEPDIYDKFRLYSLYKQAIMGNNPSPRPPKHDFIACAKYDEWAKLKNMSMEDARQKYVDLINKLEKK